MSVSMVRCRSGSISCKAPTENNMSTPIGAALSILVRGNTMKGRTRAKEEAFIRGDGDRLQVLSKPCMAPSIQEKGRFCKLTHPERSRRMRGRANRDGSVASHTPMRARERPGRLPRVIPYGRRPSGGPSPILPTRPSRPELGPQTLRVGGDANGGKRCLDSTSVSA
jgi:hypothetical protein